MFKIKKDSTAFQLIIMLLTAHIIGICKGGCKAYRGIRNGYRKMKDNIQKQKAIYHMEKAGIIVL